MVSRSRFFVSAVAGLALAAFILPAFAVTALAHPGRRPHRHRAVVVIGKPRPIRTTIVIGGRPHGVLDMNVKPKDTEVWVDGKMRGTADDFDGHPQKLSLPAGPHTLKLITPDGEVYRRELHVTAGTEVELNLKF